MKTQIDNLVRGIRHDLAQSSPAVPELATFFRAICHFQKTTAPTDGA